MNNYEKFLDNLGMPVNLKGYTYWAVAIEYTSKLNAKNKPLYIGHLYNYIANKYNGTYSRVERALRAAIERTPKIPEILKQKYNIDYKLTNTIILIYLTRLFNEGE